MQQLTDTLGLARAFISNHTIEVLMLVIAAVAMTLFIALWSLLRRRGVRRLARSLRDLQRRMDALESAEHDRTVRRIVTAEPPPA